VSWVIGLSDHQDGFLHKGFFEGLKGLLLDDPLCPLGVFLDEVVQGPSQFREIFNKSTVEIGKS